MLKKNLWTILFTFILIVISFYQIKSIGDFRLDDSYITFSFSKNLSLGNGPVYSHDLKVEGYSNFLWMTLVAGAMKIAPQTDVYLLARILMLPFMLLLFGATFKLTRSLSSLSFFSGISLTLLALSSDIFAAAVVCLETIPYTALLILAFSLYFEDSKNRWTLPILVAAALMRIDGFIPLFFFCAFAWFHTNEKKKWIIRSIPSLLVYCLWFMWRWEYYGFLFPNTYYAKSQIHTILPNRGYEYAVASLKSTGFLAALPLIIYMIIKNRNYKTVFSLLFITLHIFYVIHVGGDWMPFERFFIPILPIIFSLMSAGACEMIKSLRNFNWIQKSPFIAFSLMSFLFIGIFSCRFFINTNEEKGKIDFIQLQKYHVQINLVETAKLFSLLIKPGEKLFPTMRVLLRILQKLMLLICGACVILKLLTEVLPLVFHLFMGSHVQSATLKNNLSFSIQLTPS
ncbi:MAG: hypothetical protein IPJ69_01840 [Deltaproteobacteria bacterium]|nr:MAG: hypothetical protein IPJ69_01840 [Deltaproteobacteria bacterium]